MCYKRFFSSLGLRNSELVSSMVSLTSRGEDASLPLIDDPSVDGVTRKMILIYFFITSTSLVHHCFLLG